jgi:inner membrane protein YidH
MSADRTLMSVIRTSLSLIGFGFTIYQIFQKLYDAQVIKRAEAARNFGVGLVVLGIGMLVLGIIYQIAFMTELRRQRQQLRSDGLIHGESQFPVSLTLVVAIALLLVGIFAILNMVYHTGPFGGV